MRYFLITVNTTHNEIQVDKEFSHMSLLEAYVEAHYMNWTSLVVTVLPVKTRRG